MDLKSTYNRIAEDWHKDHVADSWWIEATDKFISILKPGDLVLDVGCGAGTKAHYLTQNGLKVIGVDFSEKMIDIARREVPGVKFQVMDMYDLSQLEKKFNGIFVQAALLHVPKTEVLKVLAGFTELLKPGGYLYVGVKEPWPGQKEEGILKENDYGYDYERFFSYFTLEEIKRYFTNLGMTVIYENVTIVGKTKWAQAIGRL